MKKTNKEYILSCILYSLCSIIDIAFALLLGQLIDDINIGSIPAIITHAVYGILILLSDIAIYRFALFYRRKYAKSIMLPLKESLYKSLCSRGLSKFHQQNLAYYNNLLLSDCDRIEKEYILPRPIIVFNGIKALLAIVSIFLISWKAALAFILFFMLPIVIPFLFKKKLAMLTENLSESDENFNFTIKETLEGMDTIVSNKVASIYQTIFMAANKKQQDTRVRSNVSSGTINKLSNNLGFLSQLLCMATGTILVVIGEISIGQLIASIQLLNSIFTPISQIASSYASIAGSKTIADKLACEAEMNLSTTEDSMLSSFIDKVCLIDFQVKHNDQPLFKPITLEFEPGKTYAILGRSGSGKTSLIHCLLKISDMYSGTILLNDIDIKNITEKELYGKVGYIPQSPYIFNDSILNNITLHRDIDRQYLNDIIKTTNLNKLCQLRNESLGDNGANLSGGERQRVSIARVLCSNTPIIVFDEPTASLDPENRDSINELIFSLNEYTRIVITHDRRPEYVQRFDSVISLDDFQ